MQQIINFLKKIIACQSTQDNPKAKNKCLQIIEKEFAKDFLVKKRSFQGRPMIVLSNTNDKKVDFILAGHIDVVPAEEDAFKLKEKDGKLYGRGVSDMKGPLAASIFAIRDYLKQNNKLKIAVFIASDEEIDGLSTNYLVEKIGYRAEFAILPDGGNDFNVVINEKGFLQAGVTVKGESAHASRPWQGENAIEKMIVLNKKLSKSFPIPEDENNWKTSVSLTEIKAGKGANQIPNVATAVFDVRYVDEKDKNKFLTIIKRWPKTSYKIIAENAPLAVSENNLYARKLKDSIEKIVKKKVKFIKESATSDAVFFTKNNIPAVLCKPKGGGEHQDEEWIDKKSLFVFHRAILDFLGNYAR